MNTCLGRINRLLCLTVAGFYLLGTVPAFAAKSHKPDTGQKAKIQGVVVSRDGNLVKVQEKKSDSIQDVQITSATKIVRDTGLIKKPTMGVNALVPGLKVNVVGTKNGEGQIEAKKVQLKPDAYAITIAEQQQILDNKAAAAHAQTSADDGIAQAGAAQSSANQAQNTADQGLSTAESATAMATTNTAAIGVVNQRVSDMGQSTKVAELPVYFSEGSYTLSKKSKADLDEFIAANSELDGNGYLIEITGYTSSTGSRLLNQTLSERRAAAVAQYLREKGGVPAWRIATPAGYGETHPAADNSYSAGRALNRRVEVKVLVSKALQASAPVATASTNQ